MSNRCRACNCRYSSMGRLVKHLAWKGQDEYHVVFQRMAWGIKGRLLGTRLKGYGWWNVGMQSTWGG